MIVEKELSDVRWHENWVKPGLLSGKQAISPAEIGEGLVKVMMAKMNRLEDANYLKVLPNLFVVELSPAIFQVQYEPIARELLAQWREKLVESLMTANNRLGKKEYRFGGQLSLDIRPSADIQDHRARILCRVDPDIQPKYQPETGKGLKIETGAAFLELINDQHSWSLHPGENIIGRDSSCDVFLDLPLIQKKRLVSSKHARIRVKGNQCILYDGSPTGKPSTNGTYVNSKLIPEYGQPLQEGDVIVLAALRPQQPLIDTPGVAVLRFRQRRAQKQ